MSRLKMAVVGCGHLGSIHARLLHSLDEVELIGVADPHAAAHQRTADQCGCAAVADYHDLLGDMEAAVIATPTVQHHQVALDLLQHDIHLLIEKPITANVQQANELIALAQERHLVLQVGHVERFNPAWNAVAADLATPQYIEAVRAGTYSFRATDVSIVLDLMIHDIDLVLSLAQSTVVDVEAMGVAMFGPHEDLAMARLKFANGCVAQLKASRVNYEPQRSMQVFSRSAFASIDFAKGEARMIRPSRSVLTKQVDLTCCPADQQQDVQQDMFESLLCMEEVAVERINAILEEQREFAASVQQDAPVRVDGRQGRDALLVAEQILAAIDEHRWNGLGPDQIGPHANFAPTAVPQRRAA